MTPRQPRESAHTAPLPRLALTCVPTGANPRHRRPCRAGGRFGWTSPRPSARRKNGPAIPRGTAGPSLQEETPK